jgi:hypothetical protein
VHYIIFLHGHTPPKQTSKGVNKGNKKWVWLSCVELNYHLSTELIFKCMGCACHLLHNEFLHGGHTIKKTEKIKKVKSNSTSILHTCTLLNHTGAPHSVVQYTRANKSKVMFQHYSFSIFTAVFPLKIAPRRYIIIVRPVSALFEQYVNTPKAY